MAVTAAAAMAVATAVALVMAMAAALLVVAHRTVAVVRAVARASAPSAVHQLKLV